MPESATQEVKYFQWFTEKEVAWESSEDLYP